MLSETEKENILNAIASKGYDCDDFELEEESDTTVTGNTYSPTAGILTVTRKSNGRSKKYKAVGSFSTITVNVVTDIEANWFA